MACVADAGRAISSAEGLFREINDSRKTTILRQQLRRSNPVVEHNQIPLELALLAIRAELL